MKDFSTPFLPGLDLAEAFYHEAVRPLLTSHFPNLPHSAALIGSGSEVLGFDDAMSTDHSWGPRLMLFVPERELMQHGATIDAVLRHKLPRRFRGYSTSWSPPNRDEPGTQMRDDSPGTTVNHRINLYTIDGYLWHSLGIWRDKPLEPVDWLTLPWQKLRALTAGRVFHDDVGLEAMRNRFRWYPGDVWLYVLAAGWMRVAQEEHLTGRAGLVGDEIGSKLIAGRLVRDVMRLAFLLERQYPPYAKWFGTAFRQLDCALTLTPLLTKIMAANRWQARDKPLAEAYRVLGEMQNALGIAERVDCTPGAFHKRPFTVIFAERFAKSLVAQIEDEQMRQIVKRPLIGSVDLFSDSTDLLENAALRPQIEGFWNAERRGDGSPWG